MTDSNENDKTPNPFPPYFAEVRKALDQAGQKLAIINETRKSGEALDATSLSSEEMQHVIDQAVDHLTNEHGLPKGMFDKLSEQDDDWTFIVKGHALVESMMNNLIVGLLGYEALRPFVEKELDMGNRFDIAERLDLLPKEAKKVFLALGQIRNTCVHNVRNTSFSIREHFSLMDKNQAKAQFALWSIEGFLKVTKEEFLKEPRPVLSEAVRVALGLVHLRSTEMWARKQMLQAYLLFKPTLPLPQAIWDFCKTAGPKLA